MLTEPQTITVNAVAKNLPRVAFGDRAGTFELKDSNNVLHTLKVTHVNGKRARHTVRYDFSKTAADPLLDGVSRVYSASAYVVIDAPLVGFSNTELEQHVQGLVDYLDAAGLLTKVLGSES